MSRGGRGGGRGGRGGRGGPQLPWEGDEVDGRPSETFPVRCSLPLHTLSRTLLPSPLPPVPSSALPLVHTQLTLPEIPRQARGPPDPRRVPPRPQLPPLPPPDPRRAPLHPPPDLPGPHAPAPHLRPAPAQQPVRLPQQGQRRPLQRRRRDVLVALPRPRAHPARPVHATLRQEAVPARAARHARGRRGQEEGGG